MIGVTRPALSDDLKAVLEKRASSGLTEREAAIWFHEDVAPVIETL